MKSLVLALAVFGCTADVLEPRPPNGREQVTGADRAVALARQAAAAHGYTVADYELADVAFDSEPGSFHDSWRVFFDHKPPGFPGGHFSAYVARDGGAVQFFPGR